jgi:hypothetical protein
MNSTVQFLAALLLASTLLGQVAPSRSQAQTPKPKLKPEDISQKIQGTVTIRNDDGSLRPAPFVHVYVYTRIGDNPTDVASAWNALMSKASFGKPPVSATCKEVLSARWAYAKIAAAQKRAEKTGDWHEKKQQRLSLSTWFDADKDGTFKTDIGIPSSTFKCTEPDGCGDRIAHQSKYKQGEIIISPPHNFYGKYLLIAFLKTPPTQYYWQEQVTVREGEKTPPVVLADPVVCDSSKSAVN